MPRLAKIVMLVTLLAALSGCQLLGEMLAGINSDQANGGAYARMPQRDADGEIYVPPTDWGAGPERVY